MKQTLTRTALAFALIGGFAAPSRAVDKETRQMMADIRMLQLQSQELQMLLGSITEKLTEAVKALNGRLDQQSETTRKSFADQKLTIDGVAGDLRIVRERMDDNNVRIGSLTQEVDALRQTILQLNVAQPAVIDPLDPAAAAGGAALSPTPAAPALAGGLSPQKTFDMAKADYMIGQYELAISGLEGYVRTFPKSEQAGEAQLLVGNSYLQLGKYDKAVEAYDIAIRTYPKSATIPEVYFRKGMSHANLKEVDSARAALEYVLKNFPDSPEATLAKQLYDKLSPPSARKP